MAMLALTDEYILPLSVVSSLKKELKIEGVEWNNVSIMTGTSSSSKLPLESSSVDTVIGVSKVLDFPEAPLLAEMFRAVKPDGRILIHLSELDASLTLDTAISFLVRKILVAGFVEPEAIQQKPEISSGVKTIQVKGRKPSWKIGSSFSLKASKGLPKVQIDDDMDLIDEDTLLTEEDLKKPPVPSAGDCEVGATRKACKNCTCGRAEEEQKVELGLTMDQLDNPQSACGSCGLGDAFRCSTCPYKGLPPFKLGEKVSLSSNFLDADI